jgi:hypothetical protein
VLGAAYGLWDFDGNFTGGGGYLGGQTEFQSNVSAEWSAMYFARTMSIRRTRGGPITVEEPGFQVTGYLDTDGKRSRFYYVSANTSGQPAADSWYAYVEPGFEWKPVSSLSFQIGPGFERVYEDAQYVTTVSDPTAVATYGKRYVFARLDQRTLSTNVRLNWAFTPALSVQIYAQPLVSAARYSRYKELARGRSYEFLAYGTNGSTFDADSLIADPDGAGPAARIPIVRWEYRPGSVFYLVWTQQRTDSEDDGAFRLGRSLDRLVDRRPENIFLAKVSYYLTP